MERNSCVQNAALFFLQLGTNDLDSPQQPTSCSHSPLATRHCNHGLSLSPLSSSLRTPRAFGARIPTNRSVAPHFLDHRFLLATHHISPGRESSSKDAASHLVFRWRNRLSSFSPAKTPRCRTPWNWHVGCDVNSHNLNSHFHTGYERVPSQT